MIPLAAIVILVILFITIGLPLMWGTNGDKFPRNGTADDGENRRYPDR